MSPTWRFANPGKYLGDLDTDLIRSDLPPIQWTGYEFLVRTYQGEFVGKVQVQERFASKLARARADPEFCNGADWSWLRVILQKAFTAFHDLDSDQLLEQLRRF